MIVGAPHASPASLAAAIEGLAIALLAVHAGVVVVWFIYRGDPRNVLVGPN